MELLADENADTEWVQALRGDGHDVARVVDLPDLDVGAPDPEVLAVATREGRVLLTSDCSDVTDPPITDHAVVIVVGSTRRGGQSGGQSGALRTRSPTSRHTSVVLA